MTTIDRNIYNLDDNNTDNNDNTISNELYSSQTSVQTNNIKYTKTLSREAIETQLENYYELKMKFEKEKEKIKNKILNSDLSTKDKRRKYRETIPKCINCNRNVGMIFNETSNNLIARCGASTGKYKKKDGTIIKECDLNISLIIPDYYDIQFIMDEYSLLMTQIKKDIKILKMNHLYGHIDDDESLKIYQELIKDYESYSDIYSSLHTKQIEQENEEENEILMIKNEIQQLYYSIIEGLKSSDDNDDNSKAIKNKIFEMYPEYIKLKEIEREKLEYKTFFNKDDDQISSNTFLLKNSHVENEIII